MSLSGYRTLEIWLVHTDMCYKCKRHSGFQRPTTKKLKLKLQYFGHLMRRADSFEKTLMLGKIEGGVEKGMTEDEMVGWHH